MTGGKEGTEYHVVPRERKSNKFKTQIPSQPIAPEGPAAPLGIERLTGGQDSRAAGSWAARPGPCCCLPTL